MCPRLVLVVQGQNGATKVSVLIEDRQLDYLQKGDLFVMLEFVLKVVVDSDLVLLASLEQASAFQVVIL